jgi:hypothetical protein
MTEPDLLREEITVQTDIAEGLRSRMVNHDNGSGSTSFDASHGRSIA